MVTHELTARKFVFTTTACERRTGQTIIHFEIQLPSVPV
jgi:hypothetical protein